MIIPTLTINYIESMLIAKEKLNKKSSPKAYLTVLPFPLFLLISLG